MTQEEFPTSPNPDPEPDAAVAGDLVDPHAHLQFQILESIQTILTALMLAFMLRAFFIEAFIIPTGSMAEGLLGQHGVRICSNCGWQFEFGPGSEREATPRPDGFVPPLTTFCPNCHAQIPLDPDDPSIRSGDRILVHKWPYVLGGPFGPHRWDVIVFRDPADPEQNFIKRLVALPNESIEIIDGDVYIKAPGATDFHIARKTPAAQSRLWLIVFDQNHLPADSTSVDHPPAWVPESRPNSSGGWSGAATRVLRHDARDDQPHTLRFDPDGSRYYLQDVCAYNQGSAGNYVGDVRIRAELSPLGGAGWLDLVLVRDGYRFVARVDSRGESTLTMQAPGKENPIVLGGTAGSPLDPETPAVIEFAHLDYRVYLKIDGHEVLTSSDDQYSPDVDALRQVRRINPVSISLVAADLSFELHDLRVDRDVYYAFSRTNTLRAYAGHPLMLGDDEYFVLGDNSPNSHDSREWYLVGPHLADDFHEGRYQVGTVPGDQIVGQAFFVYLPGLMPLDDHGRWRIPDLGRVRFIR